MRVYWIIVLTVIAALCFASGPGDDSSVSEVESGWVYGKIEYLHDLRAPNEYFMLLRAHPGQPVPLMTGGYATTDVYAVVRLRGVDTPRGVQASEDRNRPHDWLARERAKWDASLRYVWNLTETNNTFRVHNLKVVDDRRDKMLEADMEVYLGGGWLNLAMMMMSDGFARPIQEDADWDWGARGIPLENPVMPK